MKPKEEKPRKSKKRIKTSLGDVVAIPLGKEGSAYAVVLKDEDFCVLDYVGHDVLKVDQLVMLKPSFYLSGTLDAVTNGSWPIVGRLTFAAEEDSWSPPRATWYTRETNKWTVGEPRVYYREETIPAALDEVNGMDIFSVCHTPELVIKVIIDRLINGNHDNYKVRPQ